MTSTADLIVDPPVHAAQVTMPDGSLLGFGPDEPIVDRQIQSVQIATEMPGGFGAGSFVVPRSDRYDPVNIPLFAPVRIFDSRSNLTLYEGRVTGTPAAGSQSISVECEGWVKHLEDDGTAREIFMDRDLSNWQGPSVQRQYNLLNSGSYTSIDGSSQWDITTKGPAAVLEILGPWIKQPVAAMLYSGKGLNLGGIDYSAYKGPGVDPVADTNWNAEVALWSDDVRTAADAATIMPGAGAGPWTSTVLATAAAIRKFAAIQFYYAAAGGVQNTAYDLYFTLLGVFGTHGIPLRGTVGAPAAGRGLYVADMLAYIINKWAPKLKFTTGAGGSIEPTSFPVPHSVFMDAVAPRAMVESMVLYGGATSYPLDWGCYDGQQFFAKTPGNYGRTWYLRRDEGTEEDDQGADSGAALNGVMVEYDDGTGSSYSVGPPGSGADLETASLLSTDPTNPANNYPGERHWAVYKAPILAQDGALLVGRMILADSLSRPWRGTVTARGLATEQSGARWPVGYIRSGDRVVVPDDPDTRPRRVVNSDYDGVRQRASVGQTPDHLANVLAKAGIVLVGHI